MRFYATALASKSTLLLHSGNVFEHLDALVEEMRRIASESLAGMFAETTSRIIDRHAVMNTRDFDEWLDARSGPFAGKLGQYEKPVHTVGARIVMDGWAYGEPGSRYDLTCGLTLCTRRAGVLPTVEVGLMTAHRPYLTAFTQMLGLKEDGFEISAMPPPEQLFTSAFVRNIVIPQMGFSIEKDYTVSRQPDYEDRVGVLAASLVMDDEIRSRKQKLIKNDKYDAKTMQDAVTAVEEWLVTADGSAVCTAKSLSLRAVLKERYETADFEAVLTKNKLRLVS